MQNTSAANGAFEPVHSAHAIEQVVFTIQIDNPLSDEQLKQAKEIARKFKVDEDMPGMADIRSLAFGIGLPNALSVPQMSAGFVLSRMGPSGVIEKELRVDRNAITFMTTRYTRWENILSVAWNYIAAFLPIYVQQAKLTGIGLNYLDKFVWNGDISACRTLRLFQEGSKYLSSHIYEATDLWHSHSGAFIRADGHIKRLLNVNANSLDENQDDSPRRVITILTVLTDLLNQPGYEVTDIDKQSVSDFVHKRLADLHNASKMVLIDLLSEDMAKRISLVRE